MKILKNKTIIRLFIISIALCEVIREIIYFTTGYSLFGLFITASVLTSLFALYIRTEGLDLDQSIIKIFKRSPKEISDSLNPKRFFNCMPIAMVLCTIADVFININFIVGVLIFLIAHVFFILAFSGIIHLKPDYLFSQENQTKTLGISLGWIIITLLSFIFLIYNPDDDRFLMVIPYVIIITIMVIISYLGLSYNDRPINHRIILILGSTFFYISDTILGYDIFKESIEIA